jgi:hypothetical protein
MNIRYDESFPYLTNNKVPEDFFRSVPCTGSTEGNEHTALVVSKSNLETGTCYECLKEALKALKAKRPAERPEHTFVDAIDED